MRRTALQWRLPVVVQSQVLLLFVLVERVLGAAVVECVLLFVDVDVDEDLDEDEDLVDDDEGLVVEEGVEREDEDEDLVEEEEVVVVVGAWYLLGLPAVVVLWGGGVGVS
ncbi:hypothetical protein LTR48_001326 [Friedmanniomyces endolithicus]|uniref:Uncharacterized protein n=1 Tax=Rachicladosporium monterosium TaxID=1507873 RepID=A0ABR0L835_9PEZI|nr:hypothetical protein LTR48_001326 [Friedmanniomyces endolithicus]KAK5144901.1 hypothetical protein LTR32_003258 [Rachicladosporium monterosium]